MSTHMAWEGHSQHAAISEYICCFAEAHRRFLLGQAFKADDAFLKIAWQEFAEASLVCASKPAFGHEVINGGAISKDAGAGIILQGADMIGMQMRQEDRVDVWICSGQGAICEPGCENF